VPVGRLWYEIGGDTSRLQQSLREAIGAAESAGVKIRAAGQSIISKFDEALNPTRHLAERVKLLETVGRSSADIWKVMGEEMSRAADAARKNGQAVDPLIRQHLELNRSAGAGRFGLESFGRALTDFARHPVEAARSGVSGFLGTLGPMAAGLGGVAAAVGIAAKALFDLGAEAAAEAVRLENMSLSTGLAVQQLQALEQIGKEAGLESLDLGRTLGMLNQQLAAGDAGDFVRTLREFSINAKEAGKSRDVVTLLDELRAKLLEIGDPAERAQKAQAALGGRLRDLIPLLLGSRDSLASQIEVMKATGPVWDELTQEKLKNFDSALHAVGRAWSSLVTGVKATIGGMLGDFARFGLGAAEGFGRGAGQADAFNEKVTISRDLLAEISRRHGGLFDNVDAGSFFTKTGRESLDDFESRVKAIAEGNAKNVDLLVRLGRAQEDLRKAIRETASEDTEANRNRELGLARTIEGLKRELKAREEAEGAEKRRREALGRAIEKDAEYWAKLGDETRQWSGILEALARQEKEYHEEMKRLFGDVEAEADKAQKRLDEITDRAAARARERIFRNEDFLDPHLRKMPDIAGDTARKTKEAWTSQVSTIFTDMSRRISEAIVEWKGFGSALVEIAKSIGQGILRSLVENLLDPLMSALGGLFQGDAQGKSLFSVNGLSAGLKGAVPGLGLTGGMAMAAAKNPWVQGAGMAALGGSAALGGLTSGLITGHAMSLGSAFGTMGTFMLSNPWTLPLAGLAVAMPAIVKAIRGKNAWEAGAPEALRDFGIGLSQDQFRSFAEGLGLDESRAYPVRKDLESSPLFLSQVAAPLAAEQGRMAEFLKRLENVGTSWGSFNFREAFELGQATGDWAELNRQFTEAFRNSAALEKALPDWRAKLMADGQAVKTANDLAIESFLGLKAAIQDSIRPAPTMYDRFLLAGEVTEEFRAKIAALGGDLEKFEAAAGLARINDQFQALARHFRETGEALPGLRDLFARFGGDLRALDEAAALPGLIGSMSFIDRLKGGIGSLAPELDPVRRLLSGDMGPDVLAALGSAGIDAGRLMDLSGLAGMEKGWDKAAQEAAAGGRISGSMLRALGEYGGSEGRAAVEKYREGFNTVSPELLESTRAAMDQAYQSAIRDALSYLGTVEKETADKITTLTAAVETQLAAAGDGISGAIDRAKTEVVDALNRMIVTLVSTKNAENAPSVPAPEAAARSNPFLQQVQAAGFDGPVPSYAQMAAAYYRSMQTAVPSASAGAHIESEGFVYVHPEEDIVPAKVSRQDYERSGGKGTTVHIYNPTINGWNDFVEQVRRAGVALRRQSDPMWA